MSKLLSELRYRIFLGGKLVAECGVFVEQLWNIQVAPVLLSAPRISRNCVRMIFATLMPLAISER